MVVLRVVTRVCVLCACRYDPQTDVWTAVAPMSISRDAVGVCLLGDRLFAVGGYDGQVYLSTVEAYDPQTNEWTQVCTHTPRYTKKVDPQNPVCSFRFVPSARLPGILPCFGCYVNVMQPHANVALLLQQRYRKEETKWNCLIHHKHAANVHVRHLQQGPGEFQIGILEIYSLLKTSGGL